MTPRQHGAVAFGRLTLWYLLMFVIFTCFGLTVPVWVPPVWACLAFSSEAAAIVLDADTAMWYCEVAAWLVNGVCLMMICRLQPSGTAVHVGHH